MDLTLIGRALRQNKLLIALGVLVAVAAGLFSGYSISSSGLEPRTAPVYAGSSTIILTNPALSLYAAQMGQSTDASAVPQDANLSQLAMIYAWVVSGDEIREATERTVGDFVPGDELAAQRRTTQPTGDERFGANAALPIFDIVSRASSAERAEQIASAATDVFMDYVVSQQDAAGIPEGQRVDATVLRAASAELEDGGSSLISAVLVGLIVLFVAFLLIVYRANAARVRAGRHASEAVNSSNGAAQHRSADADTWGRDEAELVASARE